MNTKKLLKNILELNEIIGVFYKHLKCEDSRLNYISSDLISLLLDCMGLPEEDEGTFELVCFALPKDLNKIYKQLNEISKKSRSS